MNSLALKTKENLIDWQKAFDLFIAQKRRWRCSTCGKTLAYEKILLGIIEVKCPRCKKLNTTLINGIDQMINIILDKEAILYKIKDKEAIRGSEKSIKPIPYRKEG